MTESLPHIVYRKSTESGGLFARLFGNYADAHTYWRDANNPISDPHLIAVVGRVIDPSTPVIDPNE